LSNNAILEDLVHDESHGSLAFQNTRYLLIRPETLAAFQTKMEEIIGEEPSGMVLYSGGFEGGKLSGVKYKEEFNLSAREAVEFMCRMGGEIGWGAFQLVELDSSGPRMVVEVSYSPFAEAYKTVPTRGVCHFTRGVLGGLVEGLFRKHVNVSEPNCLALGDNRCRFEIGAAK
jgi:predicted hydrocarbon binding protein